jgi:hypothetical protein
MRRPFFVDRSYHQGKRRARRREAAATPRVKSSLAMRRLPAIPKSGFVIVVTQKPCTTLATTLQRRDTQAQDRRVAWLRSRMVV